MNLHPEIATHIIEQLGPWVLLIMAGLLVVGVVAGLWKLYKGVW